MSSNNDKPKDKTTFVTGVEIANAPPTKQRAASSKRPLTSLPKKTIDNDGIEEKNKFVKRNKLYQKILFEPSTPDYYERVNELYNISPPITPGIQFIKRIFSHEHAEKAIPYLKLNMPETYWNDTEMFYVYNDMNNYGLLSMIKNKKDFDLFDTIVKIEENQYRRELSSIDPFIIVRSRDSDYENSVKVERFEKAQDNLGKDIGDGIVQRYIRCRGRNRELDKQTNKPKIMSHLNRKQSVPNKEENNNGTINLNDGENINTNSTNNQKKTTVNVEERKKSFTKPTVVRLEYKTGYNRQKGCNVAYCLINKNFVESAIQPATKEILEKYTTLTTLNTLDENSFYIYIMSGESVAPYEFYAKQLVLYLQKWFKLLLKTIVIDFMKDERGIIYFLGVKSFTTVREPGEKGMIVPLNMIKVNDEDNIRKFYKTWTCRLCLLPYPKAKITKIVTFKLLYKLKENLKKRGFHHFDHINNNIYNESQSCRVCDLCYTLLVTEQELMEIQKTIALCNNIEVPNDELLNNTSQSPEGLVRAPQKFKQLLQWRIMFYFLKFYFFDYSKFPFEDGSNVPETATPNEKKKAKTNYKLYITLFNQKIAIPLFTEMKQFISNDEVEINSSKIFYFFSTENSNIKQILRNEEVDFRIVLNDKWNEPLATCKTTVFSMYEDNVKEKPMTSRTVLNFFSDFIKHFKCQVYIGLKNDGLVQTENLQMYCYKLPNPIYITDLDYFSYHSLPNDWYELYIPPDTKIEDETNYEIEKMIDNIINNLEGKEKKKKESNDDEVYDPYDLLVQIQNKNDIISKIESLPIVKDKEYIEMKQEEKKERPKTSNLIQKFDFSKNQSNYKTLKPKKSFKPKKTKEEKEKEKEREKEEAKMIKEMNHEQIEDLITRMDKQLNEM